MRFSAFLLALLLTLAAAAAPTAAVRIPSDAAQQKQQHRRSKTASGTTRPIVGVLTQPTSSAEGTSYIAASYVKYLESAGARVVPIFHNATSEETIAAFHAVNGVLFPGGGADLGPSTALFRTASQLVQLAAAEKDNGATFPIFGHCMGFELLMLITSADENLLSKVDAENITLPLQLTATGKSSRLISALDARAVSILTGQDVTMNNHQYGVTPDSFAANARLTAYWDLVSTNDDREGKQFISSAEAKVYDTYALQWHPEKVQFEWMNTEVIQHTPDAVYAMQAVANYFVSQARLSSHAYPSYEDEENALIYNYPVTNTERTSSSFDEIYYF